MPRRPPFTFLFAPEALEHLDRIERKHHRVLKDAIAEQLSHSPLAETRNRKPLHQPAPFDATWELRCGPDNRYRVFYDVVEAEVVVIAVLHKSEAAEFYREEAR